MQLSIFCSFPLSLTTPNQQWPPASLEWMIEVEPLVDFPWRREGRIVQYNPFKFKCFNIAALVMTASITATTAWIVFPVGAYCMTLMYPPEPKTPNGAQFANNKHVFAEYSPTTQNMTLLTKTALVLVWFFLVYKLVDVWILTILTCADVVDIEHVDAFRVLNTWTLTIFPFLLTARWVAECWLEASTGTVM